MTRDNVIYEYRAHVTALAPCSTTAQCRMLRQIYIRAALLTVVDSPPTAVAVPLLTASAEMLFTAACGSDNKFCKPLLLLLHGAVIADTSTLDVHIASL
eukprot:2087-Heterococcus_DN1.PRE.2